MLAGSLETVFGVIAEILPPPSRARNHTAAAPPPNARPPADPMSFPPGQLPSLVCEKLRTDPPYSPLSPLDVEALGLPPAVELDSYLQSRLDKFDAELRVGGRLVLGFVCACVRMCFFWGGGGLKPLSTSETAG
jgi:hypothetical protein